MLAVSTTGLTDVVRLTTEWPKRAQAARNRFLVLAVSKIYETLIENIPNDHKDLRDSLQLSRITGLPDSFFGLVIHSRVKWSKLDKSSVDSCVLYVSAKAKLSQRVPPEVRVLEEHSPWTVDTLPFQPDVKVATVVSRKVRSSTVDRVRANRKQDRGRWIRKLNKLGIRETRKDKRFSEHTTRAVSDLEFESVRLEFGLGGSRAIPHWRPAILKVNSRGGVTAITRRREFMKAFLTPGFGRWKLWLKTVHPKASLRRVGRYHSFQTKLGIRATK